MTSFLWWKIVKWVSMVVWTGGIFGVLRGTQRNERMRSLGWVTVGLVGTWFAGYLLMKTTGRTLREPWILWSMGVSLLSFHFSARVAHRDQTSWINASMVLGGFLAGIGLMVMREHAPRFLMLAMAITFLLGVAIAWSWRAEVREPLGESEVEAERKHLSWRWFLWIARAEGVSLIVLMLIVTPLKYGMHIELDGGTGGFGWMHGILSLVYVLALWDTGRQLGWSVTRGSIGFVLSLLPFGTFVFERIAASPEAEKR